ncbi:MAG: transposase [Leptotrichiaceae bacterium]|nr:transposase [Leptotrichiaceae bacterium]
MSSVIIFTALNTFKEYFPYIVSNLIYNYSNGGLEGINKKNKVLKSTAFRYRGFVNFRKKF